MQKKLVLFDFDGTIADSLPLAKVIINLLAKKHKFKELSDEEIDLLRDKDPREIKKIVGISWCRIPFIARDFKKEASNALKDIPVFPGMKLALKNLKENGFTLGIVTSNSKKNVELFLKHNQIEDCIDLIVGDAGIFGKARKIKKAIKMTDYKKEDIYYVGDEVRDIESAKKAGIKSIAVTWGFNDPEKLKELNPNFLVNTPNELSSVLMV